MNRVAIVSVIAVGVLGIARLVAVWRNRQAATQSRRRALLAAPNFDEAVRSAGLEAKLSALRAVRRSAIRLRTQEPGSVAPGRSKIGGRPDLPREVAWPAHQGQPLPFLAQLALSELAPFDDEHLLPKNGWLVFFHAGDSTWGFDPADALAWKVLHVECAPAALAPREFPDALDEDARFPECGVAISREDNLPDLDSPGGEALGIDGDEDCDAYFELLRALAGGDENELHRVLGWPDQIQGDMQLECQLVTNGLHVGGPAGYADPRRKELEAGVGDWRLLLQIDSDERTGMMFGDAGRVYFWIKSQDLIARRFERAWSIVQCY